MRLIVAGGFVAPEERQPLAFTALRPPRNPSGLWPSGVGRRVAPRAANRCPSRPTGARAGAGDMSRLPGSLRAMISLGPSGLTAFLRDSRLVERVGARVRAIFKGGTR